MVRTKTAFRRLLFITGFILLAWIAVPRLQLKAKGIERSTDALFKSVQRGDAEAVRLLLRAGVSAEELDAQRHTPLLYAIQRGDVAVMRALIEGGAKVIYRPKFYLPGWGSASGSPVCTPLVFAAGAERVEPVRVLIEAGALEKERDASEALFAAAERGSGEIVALLAGAGAVRQGNDYPALRVAIELNDEVAVRALVGAGASVTGGSSDLLHSAAAKGQEKILRILLAAGAKADVRDEVGFLPLVRAATRGHEAAVRVLLHHGSRGGAYQLTEVESAALVYFAALGPNPAINALLEPEARQRWRAPAALNALMPGAISHQNALPLFQQLGMASADANDLKLVLASASGDAAGMRAALDAGAEVNIEDWTGRTPVNHAAERGHTEALALLMAYGAISSRHNNPIDQRIWQAASPPIKALLSSSPIESPRRSAYVVLPLDGDTRKAHTLKAAQITSDNSTTSRLLDAASGNDGIERIQEALQQGADINGRDDRGITPLMAACRAYRPRLDIISFLISRGADVNAAGEQQGMTPLMFAARAGNLELVRKLLEAGASSVAKDKRGHNAAAFARNQRLAHRYISDRLRFSQIAAALEAAVPLR